MAKKYMVFLIALALIAGTHLSCSADPVQVTARYLPRDAGGFLVEFMLFNNTVSESLRGLDTHSPDRTLAWGPEGWYIYMDYRTVSWTTTEPQYMVLPGCSKSGFFLVEDTIPTQYYWWVMGTITDYQGYLTPQPVPEPSPLLALAGGMGTLGLSFLRRRRSLW